MCVCVTIANDKHKYIFQKYTIQTSLSILLSSTHIKYYSFDICQDPFSSLDLQVLKTLLDCLAVFVCFFKFLFSEGNFKMRTDLSCILVQHKYTLHKSNRVLWLPQQPSVCCVSCVRTSIGTVANNPSCSFGPLTINGTYTLQTLQRLQTVNMSLLLQHHSTTHYIQDSIKMIT